MVNSHARLCVLDTCFLIDWVRYRHREALWRVFSVGILSSAVLDEVVSEHTISVLRDWLASGNVLIYPQTDELIRRAMSLIIDLRSDPRIPKLDLPEAVCIVIAKEYEATVLTENRGAIRAYQYAPERIRPASIMNALRLLIMMFREGVLNNTPQNILHEYEEDVKHRFSRREIDRVLREI